MLVEEGQPAGVPGEATDPVRSLLGCRCAACGEAALTTQTPWGPDRVLDGAIRCGGCGATFDVVWGAPFLGQYQAEDIPGLVEIAANARADNLYADRGEVERLEGLLQRYHDAADGLSSLLRVRTSSPLRRGSAIAMPSSWRSPRSRKESTSSIVMCSMWAREPATTHGVWFRRAAV